MNASRTHRYRTLALTAVLHSFTHLYQVALLPLYFRIQHDLRLSSIDQATLLVTVMGLAYFVPSYPLGMLADRLSRKKLLAVGLAVNALGFVGLSFAPNYPLALLGVAVAGFGGSFYHPAATALIARLFPDARGKALGLAGMGASVGFFFGPLYSGWRVVMSGSWRVPVLELGLMGLAAAALFAWLADEEAAHISVEIRPHQPVSAGPHRLFPSPALWLFFLGACLALSLRDFAGSALATSASLFVHTARGLDPKTTGIALSGIYLASALSNPLFGRLSDGSRYSWGAFVLTIAALFVFAFPRVSVPGMLPVLAGFGFFFMSSYPITEAALMESVPDPIRGRVFGLFITICGLIGNLSPWLVGAWVRHLGPAASRPSSYFSLYGVLSLMILAGTIGLLFLRALRRREGLAPRPAKAGIPGVASPGIP